MKRCFFSFFLFFCSLSWAGPNDWMDEAIEKDFSPFSSGITLEMIEKASPQWHRYVRFKIIDNKVYGPSGKTHNLLSVLCRKYTIPDVEFLYLVEDGFVRGPRGERNPPTVDGPVLASTKHEDFTHVIYFADWNFDPTRTDPEHCSEAYDWTYNSILVEQTSKELPWESKIPTAIWRGGLQGYQYDYSPRGFFETPRGKLCYLSSVYPHHLNAGTNWLETSVQRIIRNTGFDPHKPFLSVREHLRFKYQVNVDGHTATYPGLQWRLLSNCTVLKQKSKNKMWYFYPLKPWVHYVPIEEDLSDLIEKIEWCKQNDAEAKKIAMQGRKLAQESLLPEHCCLYCYKVLKKYASLQKFTPTLPPGEIRVKTEKRESKLQKKLERLKKNPKKIQK